MRITLSFLALVWLAASAADAQEAAPVSGEAAGSNIYITNTPYFGPSNYVDFGARGTAVDGSSQGRFLWYRDLRSSPILDGFRQGNENDQREYSLQAYHVGYRDQDYLATYNKYGKLKAAFVFNQIPLYFSNETATLYSTPSAENTLVLPGGIQTGLQNNTIKLGDAVAQASRFTSRLQRSITDVHLTYSATRQLDFNMYATNTQTNGHQPWGGTFGFNDAVELPLPVDTRITELGAAAEWANDRGSARVGYDGSFFRNDISTLIWANPLRATDSPTAGPAQGRETVWPNTNLNQGTLSGLVNLPARSQATGYVSVGRWTQDASLIPFTINSALPVFPLDRSTAEADATVTATNFTFTSRPTNLLWFSGRFRSYDFDNKTPIFHVTNTVAYDTAVQAFPEGGTSPYSFSRNAFEANVSLTPSTFSAFRAGYTREVIHQTFRTFDKTTEDTVSVSADATHVSWLTLRAVYEHGKRTGSGLDEQTLDDIGEQVSLRQFDLSDKTADRFSGIFIVTPESHVAFNGTISAGKEDRSGSVFGLRRSDGFGYSFGMDYVPRDGVTFGFSYDYQNYSANSRSRQANPGPQFDDPTRDWTTDSKDTAHDFTLSLELVKLFANTDIRATYTWDRAQSKYVYSLVPNTTLPPVSQLPFVKNVFNSAAVDVRHYLSTHLSAGIFYFFNKYNVDDYAFSPMTLNSLAQPSFPLLGYFYRPFTSNPLSARLTYLW